MKQKRIFLLSSFAVFIVTLIAAIIFFIPKTSLLFTFPFTTDNTAPPVEPIAKNALPLKQSDSGDKLIYEIQGILSKDFFGDFLYEGEITLEGDKNTQPLRFTIGGVNTSIMYGELYPDKGEYKQVPNADVVKKIKVGDPIMLRIVVHKNILRTATDAAKLTPVEKYQFQQKQTMNLLDQAVMKGTSVISGDQLLVVDDIAVFKQ
jgi:hypothetical protein